MITAQVIKELHSPDVNFISGSLQAVSVVVLPPEKATAEALVFVTKPEQLEKALKAQSPIIVAHKNLTLPTDSSATFFQTASIQLAMATILPFFDGKMNRFRQEEKIHPLSSIHPTAHLGKGVSVGPFVVIGEHAHIGDGTTIGAGTVIECDAKVGAHTLLHPQVFIGAHCEIGEYCEIHPHTTIGADGFAFAPTKAGTFMKIPQIGKVILGNHVEVGANCAFDRAALTETRIGNGTKFDNFCHIAHNVTIGDNCVFAAGFKVAGSSVLGNNMMAGGEASVGDHVKICDGVVLAGRAGAASSIDKPGAYGGYPLEPLSASLKTMVSLTHLNQLRKNVTKILKHLSLNE
jgi:UDP-3-O-[3-hydroxymyristoyl] glucosamine N-acyltransferase